VSPPNLGLSHRVGPPFCETLMSCGLTLRAMSYLGDIRLGDVRLGDVFSRIVTRIGENRLRILQNAASTCGDYVDFLTTYPSLVHVIIPDDPAGTGRKVSLPALTRRL